jgi:ATP-binding cassette, subfamily B, bacterial
MLSRFFLTLRKRIWNNPYVFMLSMAWKYASASNRRRYLLVYAMFLITYGLGAMFPVLYGWFIDAVQHDAQAALHNAWLYASAYVGLTFAIWVFHGPARIMERRLAFQISARFQDDLVSRLVNQSMDWHKDHHSGALINRLRKGYLGLRGFFDNGFIYFQTLMQLVISMGAIVYFSAAFGAIAVVLGILSVWVNLKFDRPFIKSLNTVNEKEHELSASLTDSLGNILTVITLRIEKLIRIQLQGKIEKMYPAFRKNAIIGEAKWFVANMLVALIYAVIVIGYFYTHYEPGVSFPLGGLVMLIAFVMQFTTAFNMVVLQYSNIVQFYTDVNAVAIIPEQAKEIAAEAKRLLPWNKMEIKGLTFAYGTTGDHDANTRKVLLDNVDITLARGKHIALVGRSGAGKSTVLALLRGLYTPDEKVQLVIDEKNAVPWSALAEETTLFPQHPEIFENTLLFNLTMGISYDQNDITRACSIACIDDLIHELPDGLHTKIHERGLNLSGGQRQRIALARGVLASRQSNILLLDEPTSGIDKVTEAKIYENLLAAMPDRVIVTTTHNQEVLQYFERCLRVDNGKIIELQSVPTLANPHP